MQLLKFEIIKFYKNKKNIITLIAFVFILVAYIGLNIMLESHYNQSELFVAKLNLQNSDRSSNSDETYNILLEQKVKAIESADWEKKLTAEIQIDRYMLNEIKKGNISSGESTESIANRVKLDEELLRLKIPKILTNCSMQGFNFLQLISSDIIPIILIVVLLILYADSLSSEYEEGTYKILLLQPYSRSQYLTIRLLSNIITAIISFISIIIILFLLLGIVKGFGSPYYPVAINKDIFNVLSKSNSEIGYIPIYKFILYTIPLQFMVIISIVSISVFISNLFNNTATTVSVSIVTSVGLYLIINHMHFLSSIAQYIPVTYIEVGNIINGNTSLQLGNSGITFISGILVSFIYTIVSYISSLFIFKRKNLYC